MRIVTLNASIVTAALKTILEQWPYIGDIKPRVTVNEPINDATANCPWIGIYETHGKFSVRTLGRGSGFRMQRLDLAVVVQESAIADSTGGQDVEAALEQLLSAVTSAILSNTDMSGAATMTADDIEVTYSNYATEGGRLLKEAVILFAVETPVTVQDS